MNGSLVLALESQTVLWGQTLIYTAYVLVIMLLMGWFAIGVTKGRDARPVKPAYFYGFVGFLAVVGVSTHLITYNTIPWAQSELHRDRYVIDKTFPISVEKHVFTLPSTPMEIDCGDTVKFAVTSKDLTYGFGLFRTDHSMVLQMQVVPGHDNDIIWQFDKEGTYTVRSTEYSGPKGTDMIVSDAVHVGSCANKSTNRSTS